MRYSGSVLSALTSYKIARFPFIFYTKKRKFLKFLSSHFLKIEFGEGGGLEDLNKNALGGKF